MAAIRLDPPILAGLVAKQVLGRDDDPRTTEPGQYRFLQALVRTIALGTRAQGAPSRRR